MRHQPGIAMLLSFAGAAGAANASNLVQNPDFDDGLTGWFVTATGTIAIDDTDGVPAPPSLAVSVNGSSTGAALSSCIPINNSVNVDLHAFAKGAGGITSIGVLAYSDTTCTTLITSLSGTTYRLGAAWVPIGFDNLALPDGTASVSVFLGTSQGTFDATAEAFFDHVAFGPTGSLPEDGIAIAQEGLTGTWYNPSTSGQGFEFVIDPATNGGNASLFGAWFTYDTTAGGPESQRWFSLQASFAPDTITADVTIYQNIGGNFDAPPATSAVAVGTGTLTFYSCSSALFTYAFDGGLQGVVPLRNLLPSVECDDVGTPPPSDYGFSGAWYDPATSGQGIIAEVNPVDAQVFVGWYTYALDQVGGDASQQRWLSAQGSYEVGTDQMDLTIYASTNGTFDSDGTVVSTDAVGLATLTFITCSTATLDYAFTDGEFVGLADTIDLVRLGPALTSCPLDP